MRNPEPKKQRSKVINAKAGLAAAREDIREYCLKHNEKSYVSWACYSPEMFHDHLKHTFIFIQQGHKYRPQIII